MQKYEIKQRIINEIKFHNRLGAILYIWAHKICCHPNVESPISEAEFIEILMDLIRTKQIDIIIPDPFLIKWEKRSLKNLKYFDDGVYFIREFYYINDTLINNSKKNEPLIDTRKIDKKNRERLNLIAQQIKKIIIKFPEMKEKIILSTPDIKKSIKFHFIKNSYEINEKEKISSDFQQIINISKLNKIGITIEEQEEAIKIIKKYRKNFMCVYITLLETIQKELIYIQKYKSKIENYSKLFKEILDKFQAYSIEFAESAWTLSSIPLQEGIGIEIKTGKLYYTSLNFKDDIFYIEGFQEYWAAFDNEKNPGLKEFLINQGYIEMEFDEKTNLTSIGQKLKLNFSINTIEQLFFLCKYLFIANLFHLLFLTTLFFKSKEDPSRLVEKKETITKIFIPVLKPFFNVDSIRPVNMIHFTFEDVNKDELNILYYKYLFLNARNIERTLRTFQLFYKSRFKKKEKNGSRGI